MKNYIYFLVVIFTLVGCETNKKKNASISITDSTEVYLRSARDKTFSFKQRVIYNKKAYDNLKKRDNNSSNRVLLFKVADNFECTYHWNEMKKTLNFILFLASENNDSLDVAKAYVHLGRFYMYNRINDSAFYSFSKAQKIFIRHNDLNGINQCYLSTAQLQFYVCDYLGSEKSSFKALKYSKTLNEKAMECRALVTIGVIYSLLEDYKRANEYQKKALNILKSEPNLNTNYYIETCLNNIGDNFSKMGEYEKSIKFYSEGLKGVNTPANEPELYTRLLDNMAYSKFKLKNFDNISTLYFQSAKIRDSFKVYDGKVANRIFLSEHYAYNGNTLKAQQFANEALTIAEDFNAPVEILESLKQLIQVDPKNAAQYSQQYIQISDSLQLAERKIRNKFARIAYETEEITIEKDDAIKQKSIIMWSAIGLILLGLLGFIIKLQKTKQKELMFVQEQQKSNEAIYQLLHDRQIKLDEGRQIEKKRIAQELHDGVMNRLASTRLNLFVLNKKKDDETIEKCLGFINDIQDIEKEIRQVAHDLNNDIFSGNNSFNSILETLFNQQKDISTANIFTETDKLINWEATSSVIKINLYRILQEALQNANKYAQAINIFVTMTKEGDYLHVVIHDDGIGFNVRKVKNGIGIKNMYDRVKILSGKIDIRSVKGTLINISFPLSSQSDAQSSQIKV